MSALGLDIGGTWLRGARVEADGRIAATCRRKTPGSAAELGAAVVEIWHELGRERLVGVAAAPVLDASGTVIKWPSTPSMQGSNLLGGLHDREIDALVLDDVSAAALAEHIHASAADDVPTTTVLIAIGTGVGGGVVIEDRSWTGASGQAMDLGHMPVSAAAGMACSCGATGCLQALVSGRALDAASLVPGSPEYDEALARFAPAIAEAIVIAWRTIDPDRIILGGGLASGTALHELVAREVAASPVSVRLMPAHWGPYSGALGAALARLRAAGVHVSRLRRDAEDSRLRIALVQGPNLDLLGEREPEHYGSLTIAQIESELHVVADELACRLFCVQSNSQSTLIEWLHARRHRIEGVIVNPAGLTAGGYGLRDALTLMRAPFVEVHLSNIEAREPWHRESCFAEVALARIGGLRSHGYELALRGLVAHLRARTHAAGAPVTDPDRRQPT